MSTPLQSSTCLQLGCNLSQTYGLPTACPSVETIRRKNTSVPIHYGTREILYIQTHPDFVEHFELVPENVQGSDLDVVQRDQRAGIRRNDFGVQTDPDLSGYVSGLKYLSL